MVEIRAIKPKDLDKIAFFEKEFFHEDAFSIDSLEKMIEDKYFIGLIAENDSEVIGYLFVSYFGDEANILKVAVEKFYRKKGVAKSLLAKMLTELQAICVEKLFLEVDENNEPALKLYNALGFEKTRIRYSYYKNGANAIEMVKTLKV